ncbi:DUF1353 domain-containing protein [Neorhizobium sp. T6_25]|uniref:DUF1353 domain-containing protein n=1 Tax=Neorhizobium sp. T6_25 TaxID=2093833 RepID=UPI000CFA521B|nr:DUF1353 domain-containing protein [Neorhizobium sp. T6_25]
MSLLGGFSSWKLARQREALMAIDGFSTAPRALLGIDYDAIPVGTFENISGIRLSWIGPDSFLFHHTPSEAFRFVRRNGEIIVPENMFTDGGTIPKLLWQFHGLSPWGYAPAFLVHDWEFEAHHCGLSPKSFEEARDTLTEGIKTLMEMGLCEKSPLILSTIYEGVNSFVARRIWDRIPPSCTLPKQ